MFVISNYDEILAMSCIHAISTKTTTFLINILEISGFEGSINTLSTIFFKAFVLICARYDQSNFEKISVTNPVMHRPNGISQARNHHEK
jgi:hypothetical protein